MSLTAEASRTIKAHDDAVGVSCAAREPRVAIASWSCITPFGTTQETWSALLGGRCIEDHARSAVKSSGDRATALARDAVSHLANEIDRDAAVIVGTSKGPVESWLAGGLNPTGLAEIAATFPQIRGPRLTCSAACASGLHALIRGAMMIRAGEVKQALIIATESSLHPLFVGSFQRLGVIPKPGRGCRPFDESRGGFLISESASALLLRAVETDEPSSDACFIDRYAMGGDATHLTGTDPEGKVLRHLLTRVIDRRPIDLVHAHGTGTHANDPIELAAIEDSLSPSPDQPVLYSHKAALGHSLGAAGLLSIVISCQCHANGIVPPNPRLTNPLPARRVILSDRPIQREIRRSLAIAAGFGGATAVVSLISR